MNDLQQCQAEIRRLRNVITEIVREQEAIKTLVSEAKDEMYRWARENTDKRKTPDWYTYSELLDVLINETQLAEAEKETNDIVRRFKMQR